MTPVQALQILDSVDKDEPNKKQAAINTIVRETPKWAIAVATASKKRTEALQKELDTMKAIVAGIAKYTNFDASKLGNIESSSTPTDPNTFVEVESPAAAAPSAPSAPTNRVYQDGTPMSPEDAAKEDLMDAAIAAAANDKNAPPPGRTPFNGK